MRVTIETRYGVGVTRREALADNCWDVIAVADAMVTSHGWTRIVSQDQRVLPAEEIAARESNKNACDLDRLDCSSRATTPRTSAMMGMM